MKEYNSIGTCEKIFDLAHEKGWSDAKLARILEITPQAVSKWRRQEGAPSIDIIVNLTDVFKVSLDDLICKFESDRTIDFDGKEIDRY